ncbi:M48 family metallopeptidase [Paenibacillus radicis (ex Gao et al. 2016)]|uniref:Zinc protease n=1 Tax=Paenibacillus radicis (ex Gao et al. 2016) TaxID=1737354 RepID=A0A917H7X2_9BACL|nr:SprT family zinc-dependent metalloprotease [Paenibacillus radicis (ex Gao et al. 2016)]GGG69463.1 zinc protease [Paenibacillus radicis (ex Gao et al. 2016)]
MHIVVDDQKIYFHVQYGAGKKVSIQMDPSGLITVKAPNGTKDEQLMQLVKRYSKQILQRRHALEAAQTVSHTKDYEGNGKFLHFGKYYSLNELIETEGLSTEEQKHKLKRFYFTSCKKIVGERIKVYQEQLKVRPKSFEIVESLTKWGSCSSNRNLTFNYLLAMAPLDVIDYVVVHELVHLHHMNHDRSFWRRVGSIMPDYEEKEQYLARHAQAMTL